MAVVIDDRLVIEELLVGLKRPGTELFTTTLWYYRACRAASAGAGGHLSGPFKQLGLRDQERAIVAMLQLPDDIDLAPSRSIVSLMVDVAGRHPQLNLLNLEAVATARLLDANVWLSVPSANGVLPSVLNAEQITWQVIDLK